MSIPGGSARRSLKLPIVRWLRKGRALIIFAVAGLTVAITHLRLFQELGPIQRGESQAHDLRFRSRAPQTPHPDVVVVGITSSSLNQQKLEKDIGESEVIALMHRHVWPWPRNIHAKVIERLFQEGARIVAVDVILGHSREGDDLLGAVLNKYKDRVVLASVRQPNEEGMLEFMRPNSKLMALVDGTDVVGYATVSPDPIDGVIRDFSFRTSELREYGMVDDTQDLKGFAALAAAKFSGGDVPYGYNVPLNYYGNPRTYAHLQVEEVFLKRTFNSPVFKNGTIFRDKLVFYGPIAEALHDVHYTPLGQMPGVEIHAHVAGSLLHQNLLAWASPELTFWLIVLSAFAAGLAVVFIRNPLWQAITIFGILAGYWWGTQQAFNQGRIIIPAVPAIFSIVVTGGFGMVFLFFLEQWEKAHTRKVLNRFVSKRIAAVILKNAEDFEHGRQGERRAVTIVFSDIRSFTSWSESAQPEHLVGQLNEYFEAMVGHIEDAEGNAQKFIGDAILAAWGDTHTKGAAEDARRAVTTAVKMRATLRELNARWAGRDDRLVINIGIGINHGDVVVGEVGHPERREYTVLGDGVNFAARLESATKQFHTDCLVGEQVEALTREHFIYRHVDFLRVKGKTRPVNVFTLISDRSMPAPAWLEDYHRARGLYVSRQFGEAAAAFRAVKAQIGGEDFLCDMYAERCELYAKLPPASDWDGSYTMTEK